MSDLKEFRVDQLKEALRRKRLPSSGSKADLMKRLQEHNIDSEWIREIAMESFGGDYCEVEANDPCVPGEEAERIVNSNEQHNLLREIELLRREKELAEREVQLLTRENELLRISPRTALEVPEFTPKVSAKSIGDLLNYFTGTDNSFNNWEKQFKLLIATYKLEEKEAKILLSMRLKDKALEWFHSRAEHIELTVTQLLEEMKKLFDVRQSKIKIRRQFEERLWKVGECFGNYVHEKVILANPVPIHGEELIEYIIEGIPDEQLRNQARMQQFDTESDLLSAFGNIRLTIGTPRNNQNSSSSEKRNLSSRRTTGFLEGAATRNSTTTRALMGEGSTAEKKIRCYNCSKYGHISRDCRADRKREKGSCFKCGEKGHVLSECKSELPSQVNYVGLEEIDNEFCKFMNFMINQNNLKLEFHLKTLIDTGSPISFIKENCIPIICLNRDKIPDISFQGINGSKLNILGTIVADIRYNDVMCEKVTLYVVPDDTMRTSAVLGRDILKSFDITLFLSENGKIDAFSEILNIDTNETTVNQNMILNTNPNIHQNDKAKLNRLFDEEYLQPKRPDEPKVQNFMKIVLTKEMPFYCTPRRLSYDEKSKLKLILDDWLARGIIRESESEYASPIVLVRKRNGEIRMCIDFRTLNKITARDNFPLPLIEDQLDLLAGKKYFTLLDLKDGFFHIRMHEDSIKYTAFVTPLGQFECLKMPFGLRCAPLRFQRYVSEIFKELIASGDVAIYLDDFLIATTTIEHHFSVLKKVFKLFVENRLDLRLDKCKFLQTKLEYLGYMITHEGIRPTQRGVEAIQKFPIPKSVREVQSFLGLCSYFRKFVENFSLLAKPLYDLTRKDSNFKFEHTELEAFKVLKNRLVESPILSIYSPHDDTELHCDASASGFGAILLQRKPDHKLHPIFYFSKRTSEYESKYHSFELETLSIIYALRRFRIYLQGIKFKIITDCQSLTLTLNKKETNPRIARWVLELQEYDYELEHRSGSKMQHVDALSRHTILVLEDNSLDRNLALSQGKDETIVKLREKLEKTEDRFYEMRNGLVYRKEADGISFYVPTILEGSVIYKYHNETGHVGLDKTLENIRRTYWFPQMRKKVDDHIKACLKCIAFSSASGKSEGFLHNIPKGNAPFSCIHVDHLGPLSRSHSLKKRYIFVIVDAFTKFIRLYATKTCNSSEAIQCLREYFRAYSRPLRMISDRGSCFTSREFVSFVEKSGITHIKIATASPQANGQVERVNRTIIPMIAKLADERETHWYNVLSDVEFACNNTISRSTHETPSKLLFGVYQKGDNIDRLREIIEDQVASDDNRDLSKIREIASKEIEKNQESNKRTYDKKRKPAKKYEIGDFVMIRNFVCTPGVSTKLVPKFKGPYRVTRVLRNDRYVVADVDGFQVSQTPYQGTWESSNIRPWIVK